jgi:magnesium transporter
MFYVYVIDRREHLVGVLSMRDLDPRKAGTLAARHHAAHRHERAGRWTRSTSRGRCARRLPRDAGRRRTQRLVGLITFDDVADVLEEEATEDVQKMFGAGAEERLNSPWLFSFRKRVVWLLVNLVTAFMARRWSGMFEDMISKFAVLAFYMPIIAGMGGNATAPGDGRRGARPGARPRRPRLLCA